MISRETAIRIASEWHGGQNSALYQFASSGVFLRSYFDYYIQELENCSKSGKQLKDWFIFKNSEK